MKSNLTEKYIVGLINEHLFKYFYSKIQIAEREINLHTCVFDVTNNERRGSTSTIFHEFIY